MVESFQAALDTLAAVEDLTSPRMALLRNRQSAVAVFGRYDHCLADSVAYIVRRVQPGRLAISGNVGKDSGPLVAFGIPEADYLLAGADSRMDGRLLGGGGPKILRDLAARDGWENATNMVTLLAQDGHVGDVVVLAHSTQLLRLALTFQQAARQAGVPFGAPYWQPSSYSPNPERLLDQHEIFFEIVRMLELAEEGKLTLPNLPASVFSSAQLHLARVRRQLADQGIEPPYSTAGLKSA
jgi:hypothetical protein